VVGHAAGDELAVHVQCSARDRQPRSTSTNRRARGGRRLEDKHGEVRERRHDTHFMYASTGDFSLTSAVEMIRSNSSEYGEAKLSPTASTASAAPSFFASASLSSWREKAVNSEPSALPKMILWWPSAARSARAERYGAEDARVCRRR
jgi:hypothetical protein